MIRPFWNGALFAALLVSGGAAEANCSGSDAWIAGFVAGRYGVLGEDEAGRPYAGSARIESAPDACRVVLTRTVDGATETLTAVDLLGPDDAPFAIGSIELKSADGRLLARYAVSADFGNAPLLIGRIDVDGGARHERLYYLE